MDNNIELRTERLTIRPIEKKDAYSVFNYRSDADTNMYQGWIPKTIEDVHDFINKVATKINIEDSWFQFVIIEMSSKEIIGDIGVHFLDSDNKQAEIGCTLAKKHHGKGFATEGLKSVIEYLFNNLDKHRIIGSIDPENIQSIGLVERLGFIKEAHFRESILINGKWVDDVIYAILKREWK